MTADAVLLPRSPLRVIRVCSSLDQAWERKEGRRDRARPHRPCAEETDLNPNHVPPLASHALHYIAAHLRGKRVMPSTSKEE